MTIAELVAALDRLKGGDPEDSHQQADHLLLAFIGDSDVTRAFKAITRWYS